MKIIHLVIDNIASVSHAVIDFDASPLADADVFLISGNVGAGKSTLLDCICLALYGGTPRLSPAAKGEDADTARIMREGTASSAVTLDFIANDGTPCRARWSRRRARGRINGTLQKAEWTLTVALASEKEITYTKRVEVAEAIRQAVGLGYHDFCRTTMLAQGRFASFLKGSDDEKAGILEKLTGTRRYALIGKRIYQEYQLAADACAREEAVLASVARLSPEETDALAATLKAETAKAVDAAARADSIRASIAWINTAASLRTAKTAADQALVRAEAAFASPQAADRRSFIALWETSAPARAAAEAARKAEAERAAAEKGISALRSDVMRLRRACAFITGDASLAPLAVAADQARAGITAAEAARARAKAAALAADDEYALARSLHIFSAERELMALNADLRDRQARRKAVVDALPALEQELAEAERRYSSAAMSGEEAVEKIRALLVPGDICPVCGSKIVDTICADAIFDEFVLPLKKQYEALRAETDRARRCADSLAAQIAAADKLRRDKAADLEAEKTRFEAEQSDSGLAFSLPDNPSAFSPEDARRRLALASAAREKARAAGLRASEILADAKLKVSAADARFDAARADLEKRRAVLMPLMKNIADARPEWFDDRDIAPDAAFDETIMTDAPGFLARFSILDGRRAAAAEAAEESARAVDAFLAARNMDRAIFESLSRTSPDRIDALRIADKALADAVTAARTSIADLGRSIRAHEAARSDAVTPDLTPARLEDSLKAALAEADAARQAVGSIQAKLDADAAAAARVKEIESAVEPLRRRRLLLARLNELFGSSDGKKFRTIAQSYVLADLINSANVYMRSLMPRYRLIGSPNSYNIDVEDSYEGYARRSAKHISGGETFVVSLALALALADIGTGLGVDTLFIDEGFGNLSGKALEDAVETLRSLRRRGGRRVGIISHIESLRDRIPVRIDVEQIPGRNSSKYTVTQA